MLVNDEFASIQGTGHLLGTPQYFVRTAGCSVKCPIRAQCDERDALSKHNGVDCASDVEPADQAEEVGELIKYAQRYGMKCHLQTSGVYNWEVRFDWITVSPKVAAEELEQRYGNEMIVVYTDQTDDDFRDYFNQTSFWHYYIVPLWGAENTLEAASVVRRLSRRDGKRHYSAQEWNLTIQAHKHWGVR